LSFNLDTSVIVPLIVKEATTMVVDRWLSQTADAITTSRWAVVELSSAIGLEVRSGALDPTQAATALGLFSSDVLPSLSLAEIEPAHMTGAAALLARFDLGLRGGDALHLAISRAMPTTTLVTFDRRLREACVATGLAAIEPR
jgi:predicted nucleic acid-binding protein